ncbi:MAG: hypothetical protein U5K74_14985 [Gemmatimonadaceae bacterium]|nr:hypothetical protein [Gemmatimonadaceae bacterium]
MTPLQLFARLDQLRAALRSLAIGRVAIWALGAASATMLVGAVLHATTAWPAMSVFRVLALLSGAAIAVWRWRVIQPGRVQRLDAALWAEAHAPALRYALVTLAEQPGSNDADPLQRRLADFANLTAWQPAVERALSQQRMRVALRAFAAAVLLAVAAYPWRAGPASARGAVVAAGSRDPAADAPGRVLAEAVLVAPAYTGRTERALAFGQTVSALVGSVIRVDVLGATDAATLLVQESSDQGQEHRVRSSRRRAMPDGAARCGSAVRRWRSGSAIPSANAGCW